jgi:hypothetical protein
MFTTFFLKTCCEVAFGLLRDHIEAQKSKRKSFSLGIIQPECQAD